MLQVIEYYQRELEVRKSVAPRLFSLAAGASDEQILAVCFDDEENSQNASQQAMKK